MKNVFALRERVVNSNRVGSHGVAIAVERGRKGQGNISLANLSQSWMVGNRGWQLNGTHFRFEWALNDNGLPIFIERLPSLPGLSMKKQAGSLFYGLPVDTKFVGGIKTKFELE
jgi:hypothetical protein